MLAQIFGESVNRTHPIRCKYNPLSMLDQIRLLFAINDMIVQFVHGQVFLLLGVTMGLQYFRPSRL